MHVEKGHVESFAKDEVPAGYVRIPSDVRSHNKIAGFNRAKRRLYAKLVRGGMNMRSAIAQVTGN